MAASAAVEDPLRMIPLQLLVPRLARPGGANCYALELLGRLACVDTGLREAAREVMVRSLGAPAAAFCSVLAHHPAAPLLFDGGHPG
jgi:hypothetical protein